MQEDGRLVHNVGRACGIAFLDQDCLHTCRVVLFFVRLHRKYIFSSKEKNIITELFLIDFKVA